ncbi:MAG: DUF1275 domain-containing protein [Acetobacter sp.]|nr:DUF1275 domain-containing protein [Bacteroides sp.]MCM1340360.1 DUF1275 domain-containing protein [Acetobacter sp.]MCM1432993.1 DUF1275 domain-containing protein [Clostridiales bacterium]
MDKDKEEYLECEKRWVFGVLIFIAGFYGAFTYSIRGGVFCNAQTANFVLFAMELGKKNFSEAFYYLIPMGAYLLGAVFSEALPNPVKKMRAVRWDTLLIALEIIVVILLGFIPESAPFQISQVAINFICSMQYNTFRQAQGIPSATTFCTNHVRQIGVWTVKAFKNKNDKTYLKMLFHHITMIVCFIIGAIISTVLCSLVEGKAIWFVLIPLAVLFFDFLYADLKKERSRFSAKPHGH